MACVAMSSPKRGTIHGMALAAIILVFASLQGVASFQQSPAFSVMKNSFRISHSEWHAVEETTKKETNGFTTTLTFKGETIIKSDPVPIVSPEKLVKFFQVSENRNYLCSGRDKSPVEIVEATPELMSKWKEKASFLGGAEPNSEDSLVRLETSGINFPGLKVLSLTTLGSKVVLGSKSTYPELQFTLVGSENTAQGRAPVVWIFNKLTGDRTKSDDEPDPNNSLAVTSAEPTKDGKELVFVTNANLIIKVKFPTFLVKILPVSKEKAEEQGSASIAKVLNREAASNLKAFRDLYVKSITS